MPHIPVWNGRGRQPKQLKAQSEAIRVDQWASEQPDTAWRRIRLRDGEKGKLEAQYLHTLVWVWDGSEKQSHRWHLAYQAGSRRKRNSALLFIQRAT